MLIRSQLNFYAVLCNIQQLIQQLLLFCKKCLSLCKMDAQWKHWIPSTQSVSTCAVQLPMNIMSVNRCMFVFVTCPLLLVLRVCIRSWMGSILVSHANPSLTRRMQSVHFLYHINSLLNKLTTVCRRPYILNILIYYLYSLIH